MAESIGWKGNLIWAEYPKNQGRGGLSEYFQNSLKTYRSHPKEGEKSLGYRVWRQK